jgi:8-oxo-dGTP diphosphatase
MPDKVLFSNPWATVLDRDGWIVVRDTLGVGVAVLPYRGLQRQNLHYLAILEACPSHGSEVHGSCLSGGIEPGETPAEAAVRELEEEAGYQVQTSDLLPLGLVYPSKLLELQVHLFAVDVTSLKALPPKGDGSVYEATARPVWYNHAQAYRVPDAVWGAAMFRLAGILG